MEALWPELSVDAMAANLHKAAHLARRALGAHDAIVLAGGSVSLWPGAMVTTDVERFESAAQTALASGDPSACQEAAVIYGGELLPDDPYAEWALRRRDDLHLRHLEVLRQGAQWDELARADPVNEVAHRALMSAQVAAGNPHAAIRQFRRLQDTLLRDLGLRPSGTTLALYHQVVAELAEAGHPRRGALVGREVELARARSLLRLAEEGQPSVLLVRGEAGIGKTRLCEALLAEARDAGWTTMHGAARESEGVVPYAPIMEAVDRLLLDRPDLASKMTESARGVLARLATAVPGRGLGADPTSASPLPRQQVLSAVTQLLIVAAAGRGAVVFVDDVHAADDATVQLLHYVARASRPSRLLAILALRPTQASPALEQVRLSLLGQRVASEIELGPLTPTECSSMVEQVTGAAPSPTTAAAIWELAGGNPFFTAELASAVTADGAVTVPADLYQVIDARLASLGHRLLDALQRSSVAGGELDADEFTVLSGLDEAAAFSLLDDALATGLLEISGTAYRFSHGLVRDALGRRLAPHQRTAIHRDAAECLASIGAAPGRVAHHLLAGGREEQAVPWLHQAAVRAASVSAFADALRFVEAALVHAPERPDLLALRADCTFATGDPSSPTAFGRAAAASEGEDRAVLRAKQSWAYLALGDVAAALDAVAGATATSPAARSRILLTQGMLSWFSGAMDEAQAAADEVRRLATEGDCAGDLLDAALLQAMVAHSRGRWPERLQAELLDTRRTPELAASVYDAHLCVAEDYLYGGAPYAEIIAFAEDLRALASRTGAERGEAFASTLLGEALLLSGSLDAARGFLLEGVRLHRQIGAAAGEALCLDRLAAAAVLGRHPERAAPLLAQALDVARESPLGARHVLNAIHGTMVQAAPDHRAALRAVAEANVSLSGPMESCPPCSVPFLLPAAIACAQGGDLEGARTFVAGAEGLIAIFWPKGGGRWAGLVEARGHLALAEGDVAAAAVGLHEAAEGFDRCGQLLDAERCREASRKVASIVS